MLAGGERFEQRRQAVDRPRHRGDDVHKGSLGTKCADCHGEANWKEATFDHDKYFVLDRDHEAPCDTCHRNNDYSRYTCYGCHEHSEAKVRAEHIEPAWLIRRSLVIGGFHG